MSGARTVPRWAAASAVLAPVGMIGGWTLAASRQASFDAVRETISALASTTTPERGIMTAGLALTGVGHLLTAAGLGASDDPPVGRAGRVALAVGGVATAVVAVFPNDSAPTAHTIAASVGFGALALWPALGARRGGPAVAGPRVAIPATVAMTGLVAWFATELARDGAWIGLTERLVAGAESVWPLVVVLGVRAAQRRW